MSREAMKQALEDMACMRDMVAHPDNLQFIDNAITALHSALAEPERKPLTKEQIAEIARYQDEHGQGPWYLSFARAIEKAHGIGGEA